MKIIAITSPYPIKDEAILCNSLFVHGLEILHLRKPHASQTQYETFIQQIEPRYRKRIVVHEYYHLTEQYQLRGIHLKSGKAQEYINHPGKVVSISCHTTEEIKALPFTPVYCFLSPVYTSISKKGYTSPFKGLPDLSGINVPVIALGGITPERIPACRLAGFDGIAVLGYLWEKTEETLSRFIRLTTPFVMSIAGFDPSSGAGITADIKTFEATGSYGLGICSAVTFQNERVYEGTHWMKWEDIKQQCELQFRIHSPEYLKIGLIENLEVLDKLTTYLKQRFSSIKIIWDPILKATAGPIFYHINTGKLDNILKRFYLITPNTDELKQLFGKNVNLPTLQEFCRNKQINLLWKGGHANGPESTDHLITPTQIFHFSVFRGPYDKHGTGCILSAAITSGLARGLSLPDSCSRAQLYVSRAIRSNESRLSYHFLNQNPCYKPSPRQLPLQYITDPKPGMTLSEQVEAVCRGGVRWIQLRMKGADVAEMSDEGKTIREICYRYNTLFIINDNVEIARRLNADGVHLGKEDMDPREARQILGAEKIIGATCNTWEDIQLRQKQGVNYIGLGPFTFTTTKEKLSPVLGLEGYRKLMKHMKENKISIPVFAIGGITETDINPLLQTGIQGIALSGLIKNSDDLTKQTRYILTLIGEAMYK